MSRDIFQIFEWSNKLPKQFNCRSSSGGALGRITHTPSLALLLSTAVCISVWIPSVYIDEGLSKPTSLLGCVTYTVFVQCAYMHTCICAYSHTLVAHSGLYSVPGLIWPILVHMHIDTHVCLLRFSQGCISATVALQVHCSV